MSGASDDTAQEPGVPAGFRPRGMGGGFIAHNGPLYVNTEGARFKLGFRVQAQHCNPMRICHGGWLASFADMLLALGTHHQSTEVARRFLPTISLQMDYVAAVPLGAWVEGEMDVLRVTRAMVFAQGLIHADDVLAARCSGVMKLGPTFGDDLPQP